MNTDNDLENILNAESLDDPDYWNGDIWEELASLPEPLSSPKYWDDNIWKELTSLNISTNLSEVQDEACTEGSTLR
ncbi:hypothetical protein [Bacteroides graminisolvens]|uniref:hypothetical protein n=1 Tax=Bacteroides graminisolvens TaxID=477666 RepID=UPI0029C897F0|nr:hypothetical protein [Bacteroides graminisolvens]